ncbi:T9SS type A sorting domain-containing protein [uncultured Psychroserpens sp.]|uniref:zinc-dependent metalloprotease n=1 Tax=uncultured Psychroserpens sp. TaxID=255436 RepID=UPI002619FBDF|nr:T9SS type A sorting domain-containing protein [uncultured Psychroserpens sp.]
MKLRTQTKNIFNLGVFLLATLFVSAQEHTPQCGTEYTPEAEAYIKNLLPQLKQYEREFFSNDLQRRSSSAISSVPVKAHIIRTSSGTGGLSEAQLNAAMAVMNNYYANAYLEFFLCDGINYINNSSFYDFETNEEGLMTSANNVPNVINIYFANSVTSSSSGNGLCGYAYPPGGQDVILMQNSCATNGSTLSHEVGHFFGLPHTHGTSNSTLTEELVDGSNCTSTGDFICDTPADPQLGSSNVTPSCVYVGTGIDANGQAYVPDPLNIMSYSRKACRTQFSQGQYARMYAIYQATRDNMACPSISVNMITNASRNCTSLDVAFTDSSSGATSWQWDVDGDDVIDYTTQNPSHTYNTEGVYDVALTISNGSETITRVFQEIVEFDGTQDISTSEINLILTLDDYPTETTWELRDGNDALLYSGGPYIEGTDDFTTINETFTVASNECYSFTINDSFGDGICCSNGTGSYTLTDENNFPITVGGQFTFIDQAFMANDVLGIDDYFVNSDLSLFPNPSNSIITIKTNNTNNLPDTYAIYNMLGQLVKRQSIAQLEDLSINVEAFSDGMYFIKLQKDNDSSTLSFIKN